MTGSHLAVHRLPVRCRERRAVCVGVSGSKPTDRSGHGLDEQGCGPLRWHRLPSRVGRGADRRGPCGQVSDPVCGTGLDLDRCGHRATVVRPGEAQLRRRRQEQQRPRDRLVVQVRPGHLDFLQLALTVLAEVLHGGCLSRPGRVHAELAVEKGVLPRAPDGRTGALRASQGEVSDRTAKLEARCGAERPQGVRSRQRMARGPGRSTGLLGRPRAFSRRVNRRVGVAPAAAPRPPAFAFSLVFAHPFLATHNLRAAH